MIFRQFSRFLLIHHLLAQTLPIQPYHRLLLTHHSLPQTFPVQQHRPLLLSHHLLPQTPLLQPCHRLLLTHHPLPQTFPIQPHHPLLLSHHLLPQTPLQSHPNLLHTSHPSPQIHFLQPPPHLLLTHPFLQPPHRLPRHLPIHHMLPLLQLPIHFARNLRRPAQPRSTPPRPLKYWQRHHLLSRQRTFLSQIKFPVCRVKRNITICTL